MRTHRQVLIAVLALLFLVTAPFFTGIAQTGAESADTLLIENTTNPKRNEIVYRGQEIKLITTSGERIKGRITHIGEDRVTVEGQEVRFSQVSKVRLGKSGKAAFSVGGMIVGLVGLLTMGLGFLLAYLGLNYDTGSGLEGCAAALAIILLVSIGVALGVGGALIFILGGIGVLLGFAGGKAFRIGSKWRLKAK